jgi:hypothetical protein
LSRPVTGLALKRSAFIRRVGLASVASVLMLGVGVGAARTAFNRLSGEALYSATMHWFRPGEENALQSLHTLSALAKNGKLDSASYANRLEAEVIPFWREADIRESKIEVPPNSVDQDSLHFLQGITRDRLRAYKLLVKGLREGGGDTEVDAAIKQLDLIQARIEQRRSTLVSAKSKGTDNP